jgi:hypothetical protein
MHQNLYLKCLDFERALDGDSTADFPHRFHMTVSFLADLNYLISWFHVQVSLSDGVEVTENVAHDQGGGLRMTSTVRHLHLSQRKYAALCTSRGQIVFHVILCGLGFQVFVAQSGVYISDNVAGDSGGGLSVQGSSIVLADNVQVSLSFSCCKVRTSSKRKHFSRSPTCDTGDWQSSSTPLGGDTIHSYNKGWWRSLVSCLIPAWIQNHVLCESGAPKCALKHPPERFIY